MHDIQSAIDIYEQYVVGQQPRQNKDRKWKVLHKQWAKENQVAKFK